MLIVTNDTIKRVCDYCPDLESVLTSPNNNKDLCVICAVLEGIDI